MTCSRRPVSLLSLATLAILAIASCTRSNSPGDESTAEGDGDGDSATTEGDGGDTTTTQGDGDGDGDGDGCTEFPGEFGTPLALEWERIYEFPDPVAARDATLLTDGRLAIVGSSRADNDADFLTVLINPDGGLDESIVQENGWTDGLGGVRSRPDGGFVVVGDASGSPGASHVFVGTYDSDGELQSQMNHPSEFQPVTVVGIASSEDTAVVGLRGQNERDGDGDAMLLEFSLDPLQFSTKLLEEEGNGGNTAVIWDLEMVDDQTVAAGLIETLANEPVIDARTLGGGQAWTTSVIHNMTALARAGDRLWVAQFKYLPESTEFEPLWTVLDGGTGEIIEQTENPYCASVGPIDIVSPPGQFAYASAIHLTDDFEHEYLFTIDQGANSVSAQLISDDFTKEKIGWLVADSESLYAVGFLVEFEVHKFIVKKFALR